MKEVDMHAPEPADDDDALVAALRALPPPAAVGDGDSFTAAVMREVARERAAAGAMVPGELALARARAALLRERRRARWVSIGLLAGGALGAALTAWLASALPVPAGVPGDLALRPIAAALLLVLLLVWTRLRGGLR